MHFSVSWSPSDSTPVQFSISLPVALKNNNYFYYSDIKILWNLLVNSKCDSNRKQRSYYSKNDDCRVVALAGTLIRGCHTYKEKSSKAVRTYLNHIMSMDNTRPPFSTFPFSFLTFSCLSYYILYFPYIYIMERWSAICMPFMWDLQVEKSTSMK